MSRRSYIVIAIILIVYIVGIHWWASSGYILESPIGEACDPTQNCDRYNVFFNSAWRLASVLNNWNGLITAIAAAFVAWFTWTLWQSSEKMWKVSTKAANAAKDAADAANASVKLAEDTARRQLRAYVTVTRTQIENFGPDRIARISAVVENNGETPAYKLRFMMNVFAAKYPAPAPKAVEPIAANSVLGPGADLLMGPLDMGGKMTSEVVNAIVAGKMAIYVRGVIKYDDAFGENRTTKFNLFYRGNGTFPTESILKPSHAEEGNDAD